MNKNRYKKTKRKAWSLMGNEPSFMTEQFSLPNIAKQCGISCELTRHFWVQLCIQRYHNGFYQRFVQSMKRGDTSATIFRGEFVAMERVDEPSGES